LLPHGFVTLAARAGGDLGQSPLGLGFSGAALELLRDLPEEQRAAIEAHVIDELAYAELAAGGDVSPAAMRKRVSRGLVTLRQRSTREGGNR
jgi:DNA-directed RNA polymerase specialized sigma24 family protein